MRSLATTAIALVFCSAAQGQRRRVLQLHQRARVRVRGRAQEARHPVPEGTPFNRKEIDAALKRQGGMRINKGDVVIFYTGWTKLIGKDDKALRLGGAGSGHGIMILENVHAEEAVREKVSEGLFTLGPSRITGAVQAIINPIFVY